jgi:hypothetical protein
MATCSPKADPSRGCPPCKGASACDRKPDRIVIKATERKDTAQLGASSQHDPTVSPAWRGQLGSSQIARKQVSETLTRRVYMPYARLIVWPLHVNRAWQAQATCRQRNNARLVSGRRNSQACFGAHLWRQLRSVQKIDSRLLYLGNLARDGLNFAQLHHTRRLFGHQ